MDTKPEIPTQGGSYERQEDGTLKKLHATQPAPEPGAAAEPAAETPAQEQQE